ncbi:MAG: hypothetical protein J6Z34_05375, partial [Clostridia bacterium]|nr:hypothetical protein [Clostridia bacterium]
MKSKRFITLVAIFVISLLAGAAAFGFTAFADGDEGTETPSFNASDYFTTGNDLVSIENDKLVIDFTAAGQKVVSRYDFYLPLTEVDTDVEVETNTGAAATAAGKLEITSKAEGKVTVEGITTNGNDLYLITNGEFNVGTEFYYVDDFTFASYQSGAYVQLWGYKYYDADFTVYHGFCKDIQKKIIITYGDIDVSSTATDYISEKTTDENVKVYSAPATIKFLDNSDNVTIRAYWGYYYVKENGNEGFYYKNAELQVEKELDATAPVYEGIDGFFAGGDDSEYAAYNNETVEKQLKSDGKYYQIGSSTYFYVIPNSELKNKGVDAFEPYFKKYVKSDYFPGEDLTAVVYYKTPGSDSFTKLSSTTSYKRFSLTDLGEYEYYVLATDPMGNEMEINEDWTLKSVGGVYGYYDDANALQIPVFCFSMGNAGPSAEKSDSYQVAGYVGTSYTKVNSFTTKGNDVSAQYSLWYNKGDVDSFPVTSGNDG